MVKTITIADDVYYELLHIKGDRSFSELLRELLRERKGNVHVLRMIFGVLTDEEYEEIKRSIKEIKEEFEEWGQSLTRV